MCRSLIAGARHHNRQTSNRGVTCGVTCAKVTCQVAAGPTLGSRDAHPAWPARRTPRQCVPHASLQAQRACSCTLHGPVQPAAGAYAHGVRVFKLSRNVTHPQEKTLNGSASGARIFTRPGLFVHGTCVWYLFASVCWGYRFGPSDKRSFVSVPSA